MGLRKGQRELVNEYRDGQCAVPAIPGGGKTHCLSLWAVEMIENNFHKPGKILIVTYMNTAVSNFKQRISSELQKREITSTRNYFVSTIHGLCLQIIKEKPDLILLNDEFSIIDDTKKTNIIKLAVDEWKRNNEEWFKYYLNTNNLSLKKLSNNYKKWEDKLSNIALSVIGDFKTRGMKPENIFKISDKLSKYSIVKMVAYIYEIYDRNLKIKGYIDFDDMLYNAKKLLQEDEDLLKKYQSKYSFVCEDEAQDSNYIQNEILKMIANGNLLRVGDSNQAICGSFSNSDFRLFKDFCNNELTTVYKITESSRNTNDIINLANYFVKYVRESHPIIECRDSLIDQYIEPVSKDDEMQNPKTDVYGINTGFFMSWEEEANRITYLLGRMIKKHPDKTIAVLIPSAWKISKITDILDNKKVNYEELSNTSEEKNKPLRVLGRVIDFIVQPQNIKTFADMIDECFGYLIISNEEYEEEFMNKILDEKEIFIGFLKSYPVEDLLYPIGGEINTNSIDEKIKNLELWSIFLERLDLIKDILEFPFTIPEKLVLYISEKLKFNKSERAIAQKVAGDVPYLMNGNINWRLQDLAVELLNKKNIFNFFAGIVWELKGYEPKPGLITVSTYHKAKGLEWDIVFLAGLSNQDFPSDLNDKFMGEYWFLKDDYKNPQAIAKYELEQIYKKSYNNNMNKDFIKSSKIETIAERARLLYVGITRAKKYLYLSGHKENEGKINEVRISNYLIQLKEFIDKEREKWMI